MRVILAPVGAGKTEQALATLCRTLDNKPLARVWVLLATARQQTAFRRRLIDYDDGRSLYFNIEFFNFYDLNRRLLNLAGVPSRCLNETARYSLLRAEIARLHAAGELSYFGGIALTPGFIRIVAELIYELKQNLINPEAYADAARATDRPKDRELSLIYGAYQAALKRSDLVDREGEGWLALETVRAQPRLPQTVDLLIVDGYDQFTPVQASLLAELARRTDETLITLTTVPGREQTVGRRFARALDALRQYSPHLQIDSLPGVPARIHPDLSHLIAQVFAPDATRRRPTDGVRLIEAAEIGQEVAAVLRAVRALLLDGVPPDEILIAVRDWGRYQAYFAAFQRAYRLPLVLHYGEPLGENPLIAVLLSLLDLPLNGFHRRVLLAALESPYVNAPGIGADEIATLAVISQELSVIRGRDDWLSAIDAARLPGRDADNAPTPSLIDDATADHLRDSLSAFFDALTPPPDALPRAHIAWLEALIGNDPDARFDDEQDDDRPPAYTLNLIAGARNTQDEAVRARDLLALHALKGILRSIATAQDLIDEISAAGDAPAMAWGAFLTQLRIAVENGRVNPYPSRDARVLVTSTADARGLPHRHVFIVGLAEGVFPAPAGEDPLYLDGERQRLTALGVPLSTQAERSADDGLFYELVCLPSESLTLSRPTAQEGEPWVASHFWRATLAVFDDPPTLRLRAGELATVDQAACLDEVALAVADGLSQPIPPGHHAPDPALSAAYNWLIAERPDAWAHIRQAHAIESRRLDPDQPHDRYSGRLEDTELIDRIAHRLDPAHYCWSASQLNTYGTCPYRFFAQRLLGLEPFEEPEEGMDALRRGSLVHEILEHTYRAIMAAGWAIHPDHQAQAVDCLHETAASLLPGAPERHRFRPTALWSHEQRALTDQLARFVQRDFSADSAVARLLGDLAGERRPYRLEAPFGRDGAPALTLTLPNGDTAQLNGYIDRIDRVGDALVVMDYKTGSTPFRIDDMREGRNYQMIVYLLAAQALSQADGGAPVAGGFFWHVNAKESASEASGVLRLDDDHRSAVIEPALARLGDLLAAVQAGNFSAQPSRLEDGKCSRYCEFQHLCRLCALGMAKGT